MTLRYTKIALLVFGFGMVAGLVVVVGEFAVWERPAAALMALGLVLIPLALFADGHGMAVIRWMIARLRRKPSKRRPRRASPSRRRKPSPSARRTPARSRSR